MCSTPASAQDSSMDCHAVTVISQESSTSRLSGPVDSMAIFACAEDVTAVLVVVRIDSDPLVALVLPRAAWPGLQAAASLLGACPSQEAVSAGVTSQEAVSAGGTRQRLDIAERSYSSP